MARRTEPAKPDTSLLSEEDIRKVKEQARKEYEEEQRAKQRTALLQAEKRQHHSTAHPDPNEEMIENVYIDLPPFADRIALDGVIYFHGTTHDFPIRQYHSIREIMARAWDHENETKGRAKTENRQKGFLVSGVHGVINTSQLGRR